MINIFIIFYLIISPIFSLKEIKPKLCINCKYYLPTNNNDSRFAQCSLFPREENKINFLVNGIYNEEYKYCSTSRSFDKLCGEEGRFYKKKIIKKNM